jgi:hypothetical protein
MRLEKLDTLQNACLRVVEGFSRTTPVHVLSAANTIPTPEQRRTWMTGKEVLKGVSLNTPLSMTIRKLLETHDRTSTANFNLMENTALKIRHLVEAMDEEKISFYEQTAQNLVIETGLEGIENAKRNYNDTTLRQNALREIELKKPALMVYTDGSIMGAESGVGLYCETKGFKGKIQDREGSANLIGDRNCNELHIPTRRTKGCHNH